MDAGIPERSSSSFLEEDVAGSANEVAPERLPPWRVALLVASSALLSGMAVVLWNRRALQRMRQAESIIVPEGDPEEFI